MTSNKLPTQAGVVAAKKQLREGQKRVRAAACARWGASAGVSLAAHGIGFAGAAAGAIVSAFSALADELDPAPLLARLAEERHPLCLPVMQGRDQPLLFRAWQSGDAMVERLWGIREPLASAAVLEPDVVLVPTLAFDRRGYRLGYGGGYYDRALAALRAAKPIVAIGLAYDELEIDAVPHLDYDQRLDWVLTPTGPRNLR